MFAFLATQYLYIFSATVTLTYTLEVLVVLTTVVLANILVLAVTGLLRYGFWMPLQQILHFFVTNCCCDVHTHFFVRRFDSGLMAARSTTYTQR